MALYSVAICGSPTPDQLSALKADLAASAAAYGLNLGDELEVLEAPATFRPPQRSSAVAVFFGSPGGHTTDISAVLDPAEVTVVPVASKDKRVADEIPALLRNLNCVLYESDGRQRLLSTVLECIGLLRTQRRVFLSYRREEATAAALQLFSALSARGYEVFLDTHGVGRAVDFQEALWHRLCDVDVMVMLESPTYFASQWTTAEFGRALAKNIGVVRVQWPDRTPSIETQTCSRVELVPNEIDMLTGRLDDAALHRIGDHLERFRSLAYAARRLSIMSQLRAAVESIQGQVLAIGPHFTMEVSLPGGRELVVNPIIGVPNSAMLEEAIRRAGGRPAAVLYDHVGVMPSWNEHLAWLGRQIPSGRWIRASQAAWDLAEATA
jgi:hypothetical protein